MKNILEICQEVADLAATSRPVDLFDNSSVQEPIYLSIAKTELDSLLRYGNWQELTKEGKLVTANNKISYFIDDFCPDFYCMLNNTVYIKDSQEKVIGSITPEQWMQEKYFNDPSTDIKFKIQNGKLQFLQTPPNGVQIVFMYRSSTIVYDATGGYEEKSTLTKNTDIPVFDEFIVKLGILWRWLKRNGMDYTEEYNEYQRELSKRFADGLATKDVNLGGPIFDDGLGEVYINAAKTN